MSSYWLLMVFEGNFRSQWEERALGTRSCDKQQPFLEELGHRERAEAAPLLPLARKRENVV